MRIASWCLVFVALFALTAENASAQVITKSTKKKNSTKQADQKSTKKKNSAKQSVQNGNGAVNGMPQMKGLPPQFQELLRGMPQGNQNQDLSISVSDGDREEGLQVNWKDGSANVTYSNSIGGKTIVKKYLVKDIAELKKKNPRAFEIYKQNSKPNFGKELGLGMGTVPPPGYSPGDYPPRRGFNRSSASASSSSWQRSGASAINGRTQRFNRSGSTRRVNRR